MRETVLGNILKDLDFVPADNQLLRCKWHKKKEANFLMNLPENTSFLDIGAHFGDTSLTLALFAKENKRSDINFFAFDPNPIKCEYIQKMSDLNELNIKVFNLALGEKNGYVSVKELGIELKGHCTYAVSEDGNKLSSLNEFLDLITPVGIMHVDVEGWETKVLLGADKILENVDICPKYVILECWSSKDSIRRGFSNDPEFDIINEMNKYSHYNRIEDIIDCEKNLVYQLI